MGFTEVSWSNGDLATETKMDQMVASDVYVREEAAYKIVFQGGDFELANLSAPSAAVPVAKMMVDGVQFGSSETGPGFVVIQDADISSIGNGLHYLEVVLTRDGASPEEVTGWCGYFYKTEDLDYLTCVAYLSDDVTTHTMSKVTVIGHRQPKSWTT